MLRSVLLLLSGNAFTSLLGFARNILIARLLSVEDYGIAVTFALSVSLVEMVSAIGVQQLIVQAREGDTPAFQNGLQAFHLIRGVAAGTALFLLASPVAHFLGVPELTWAYQVLALIPTARGFEHFDIFRLIRHRSYGPIMLYKLAPMLLGLLAVWPLAIALSDYRIMLYSLLFQHLFGVIASHLMAERAYRVAFDQEVIGRAFYFGWPLLLNNALLFLVMQGERIIVAREISLEALALFSMGLTLAMTPMLVAAQTISLFFLPRLSQSQDDFNRFSFLARAATQASFAAGILLVLVIVTLGDHIVHVLLGNKYFALTPFLLWFGVWQAIRVFRVGVTQAALAKADTRLPLFISAFRSIALLPTWLIAAIEMDIFLILLIAIIAECATFALALWLSHQRLNLSFREFLPSMVASVLALAILIYAVNASRDGWFHESWLFVVSFITATFALSSMGDLLRPLKRLFRRRD